MKKDSVALFSAAADSEKIETAALHLLFRHLGDAVKVRVQQERSIVDKRHLWRVDVYGSDAQLWLGYLLYTADGEFLPENSTAFRVMRQKAVENATAG
ncbi:MAG: hypothetical protein DYG89_47520 [Caldilinea sp. CFX5]|nr:hypothetical protein [Caldilinea sp. CFX5]